MSHKIITTAKRKKTTEPVPLAKTSARATTVRGPLETEVANLRGAVRELETGAGIKNHYNWYIDPVLGSDGNNGRTASTALKSILEFMERTRSFAPTDAGVTVNILNDVDSTSEPAQFGAAYTNPISNVHTLYPCKFKGVRTVLRSGTFTSVVAANFAIDPVVVPTVTDTALPGTSWADSGTGGTTLVLKQIKIVGGARDGAVGFIYQDLGSKEARIGPMWREAEFAIVVPQSGDAYEVADLTRFNLIPEIRLGEFYFEDMQFAKGVYASGAGVDFVGCLFKGDVQTAPLVGAMRYISIKGCFLHDTWNHSSGPASLFGCLLGGGFGSEANSYVSMEKCFGVFGLTPQSCELIAKNYSFIDIFGYYGVVNASSTGVLQCRNNATIRLRAGAVVFTSGGAGGAQGVWLSPGSRLYWHPLANDISAHVFFNGSYTQDFMIGEVGKNLADLTTVGYINPANLAAALPTKRHPGD